MTFGKCKHREILFGDEIGINHKHKLIQVFFSSRKHGDNHSHVFDNVQIVIQSFVKDRQGW